MEGVSGRYFAREIRKVWRNLGQKEDVVGPWVTTRGPITHGEPTRKSLMGDYS
jgi:hypothetical protein